MKTAPIFGIASFVMLNSAASAQQIIGQLSYSQSTHTKIKTGEYKPDSLGATYHLSLPQGRGSYGAGIGVRFGYDALKPMFCQAEATGFYQKATYTLTDSVAYRLNPTTYTPKTYETDRFRLDLPIQAGLKISWVRIQGGIVPSMAFPDAPMKNFDAYWTELFNSMAFAYTYGVGLDIKDFVFLDVRYQNDFGQRRETTAVKAFDNTRVPFYYNNGQFLVKLGILLNKKDQND